MDQLLGWYNLDTFVKAISLEIFKDKLVYVGLVMYRKTLWVAYATLVFTTV